MNNLFSALMHAAALLSGYTEPTSLPRVDAVSHSALEVMMCGHTAAKCDVPTAIYYKGTVFYDKSMNLDSEYERSIIVHEMVHYLQDRNRWQGVDCINRIAREDQAYRLQYQYLLQHGIDMPALENGGTHEFCPATEVK